jgi:hypothetical protein
MKKILLAILSGCSFGVNGQPVLLQSNLAPNGFTANINLGVGVSPGPAGANQTWNYSSAVVSNVGTYNVINCSSTPCASSFPLANWCFSIPGPKYKYFNSSSSILEQSGNDIPANCNGGATFSNPRMIMIFPFNYTNSSTDPWVSSTSSGTITLTYDGYGILITPFGTYNNVVRVTNTDVSGTSTVWFNASPIYQIMTIDAGNNTIILSNETLGIDETVISNAVALFPNPSNGIFSFTKAISLPNAEVEIYNLCGERIYSNKFISDKMTVDLSKKAKGVYFYKILSQGIHISNGKISIQ